MSSIYNSDLNGIDLEVIVVDNGSNENHDRTFKDLFPAIVYIEISRNLGFAKGNNVGLASATKEYILFLNSDTLITDRRTFIKSIQVMKSFNDRIVLTTRLLTAMGDSQVAYGFLPSLPLEVSFTLFLYKLLPSKVARDQLVRFIPDESRLIDRGYITATYYLFPRAILPLLPEGKLYEQTFLYGEELFWATQWARAGVKMYYLADVAIIHLVGQSSVRLHKDDALLRRRYQIEAEDSFLRWRYKKHVVILIYFFRLVRFCILSPFDVDIRTRLVLMLKLISKKDKSNG